MIITLLKANRASALSLFFFIKIANPYVSIFLDNI